MACHANRSLLVGDSSILAVESGLAEATGSQGQGAGFIDLDLLLTRIRHAQSKVYFLDAVKPTAEKADASFMDARRGSL
jgi:hypothetical protein